MAADLYEEKDHFVVEMELPGVDPKGLEIRVEKDHLVVSGTREEKPKGVFFYTKEIPRGRFERWFPLPSKVKIQEVTAEYNQGVLKIRLPKEKGKIIPLEVKN